jgi:hypothetical protein
VAEPVGSTPDLSDPCFYCGSTQRMVDNFSFRHFINAEGSGIYGEPFTPARANLAYPHRMMYVRAAGPRPTYMMTATPLATFVLQ